MYNVAALYKRHNWTMPSQSHHFGHLEYVIYFITRWYEKKIKSVSIFSGLPFIWLLLWPSMVGSAEHDALVFIQAHHSILRQSHLMTSFEWKASECVLSVSLSVKQCSSAPQMCKAARLRLQHRQTCKTCLRHGGSSPNSILMISFGGSGMGPNW